MILDTMVSMHTIHTPRLDVPTTQTAFEFRSDAVYCGIFRLIKGSPGIPEFRTEPREEPRFCGLFGGHQSKREEKGVVIALKDSFVVCFT